MTAHGASLKVTTATIGFGQLPIGDEATEQALTIENVGDRAVTMALVAPTEADFQVTWTVAPTAASVAAARSSQARWPSGSRAPPA